MKTKRKTGYFMSKTYIIMQNSPTDVGNGASRQGEKQVASGQTYTHTHKIIQ